MAEETHTTDDSMLASMVNQSIDPSLAKFILDLSEMLDIIYIRLNGMEMRTVKETAIDGDTGKETKKYIKKYVRDDKKALMSLEGVDAMVGTLMNAVNHKGVFMSNFNDWETTALSEELLDDLATVMFVNYHVWQIKSISDMTVIIDTIRTNLLATLKRPFEEGERKFYKKTVLERRNIDQGRSRAGLPSFGRFRGAG